VNSGRIEKAASIRHFFIIEILYATFSVKKVWEAKNQVNDQ
jgi:hypothetical protein